MPIPKARRASSTSGRSRRSSEVLGAENAAFFAAHYDVSAEGNFEGHNILNRLNDLPRSMDDEHRLAMLRPMLHKTRETRVRPGLDDKILADWNGLMIAALVNAGVILDQPGWLTMARARLRLHCAANGAKSTGLAIPGAPASCCFRAWRRDFAAMIRAALALYEATGERAYLEQALTWQRAFDAHYADPDTGGYYLSADDAADLLLRPHSTARRRHAQSERGGGAKSGAARRARRRRPLARAGRPADRGHSVGGRAQSVRPCGAAQCARPAPARRRDRGDRPGRATASRKPR